MRTSGLVLLLVLVAPSSASATGSNPSGSGWLPSFSLPRGTVENRTLTVRCEGSRCRLTLEFDALAGEAAELESPLGWGGGRLLVDGQEVESATLSEGQRAHVRVEAERDVRVMVRDNNPFWLLADPLWARHLLLAPRSREVTSAQYDATGVAWEPFENARQVGPLRVDTALSDVTTLVVGDEEIEGVVDVQGNARIQLRPADTTPPPFEWVRSGGPFLAAGATLGAPEAARVRLGYEFGVTDWMIVSGAVESDFERHGTLSLTLEGVTPNFVFLFLGFVSVSTGVGAVAEITDQGARGAVRFLATAQAAPVGLQFTVDYFPEGDESVLSLLGRVSL